MTTNKQPFLLSQAEKRLVLRIRLLTKGAHLCTIVKGNKQSIDELILWNEGRKVERVGQRDKDTNRPRVDKRTKDRPITATADEPVD